MDSASAEQQVLNVGKDVLTIQGDFVTIDAAQEMPDWEVREFRRLPIFLGDFKFFLRQRTLGHSPFAMRYLLERWPDDAHFDSAPVSFTYDEQFVLERDTEHARRQRLDKLGAALMALYPVLGFLWSGTKQKLIPAGFVPRSITSVSVFTGVCLLVLQGTFVRMRIGVFTLLFGKIHKLEFGLLALDYALFALLLVDIVLRFDQHIKGVENPWGFCEWITKPFRKKPSEEEEQN